MTVERPKKITLEEFLKKFLMGFFDDESYCIYGSDGLNSPDINSICYVGDYPDFDDDDEEIFPDYVREKGLQLLFRDELIQDVFINLRSQSFSGDVSVFMDAINYYNENDNFMRINE